jgi:hypothetical protein
MEVYIVYMELLLGHEKITTKSGTSLNAETLNRGFTVLIHPDTDGNYTSYIEYLSKNVKAIPLQAWTDP